MTVRRGWARDGGSAALETVILGPPMLALISLAIIGMRFEVAAGSVDAAAHDAARAASISRTEASARANAHDAADTTLQGQGLRCSSLVVDVDTADFGIPVGQLAADGGPATVRVTVTCAVLIEGLPISKTVSARYDSPIDQYRGRQE